MGGVGLPPALSSAGVGKPVVPASGVLPPDAGAFASAAAVIGYPVVIKAAAGGGGKGMRIVREATALPDAIRAAAREATAAFADGRIYLERYLERPRHVEVQVFGDTHGRLVHLGERHGRLVWQGRKRRRDVDVPVPAARPGPQLVFRGRPREGTAVCGPLGGGAEPALP